MCGNLVVIFYTFHFTVIQVSFLHFCMWAHWTGYFLTKNGYKVKSSVLTEKLESLSPSEREKILQMVDIMLGEK